MKVILSLVCVVFMLPVFGQNLIFNPSFEEYVSPSHDIFYAKDWFIPNDCTVDYFTERCPEEPQNYSFVHVCSSTRNKKTGYNKPYSGEAYIGLFLLGWYGGMEHYTGRLKEPLIEGNLYKISFYIKYGGDVFWLISERIEVLFTKDKPSFGSRDYRNLFEEEDSYVADIRINIDKANEMRSWIKCSAIYRASGGELFMTLGLFKQEKNRKLIHLINKYNKIESQYKKQKKFVAKYDVNPLMPNPTSKQNRKDRAFDVIAYYLIDDVEVVPVDKQGSEILLYPELLQDSIRRNNADFKEPIEIDSLEIGEPLVLKNIYFETDKRELLPTSYPELDKLIKALQYNRQIKIEISGHTDNTGTEEYNLKLSEQRAKSVVKYLLSKGIDHKRLEYKGYGSNKPLVSNKTEEGRANNRRVELKVLESKRAK